MISETILLGFALAAFTKLDHLINDYLFLLYARIYLVGLWVERKTNGLATELFFVGLVAIVAFVFALVLYERAKQAQLAQVRGT